MFKRLAITPPKVNWFEWNLTTLTTWDERTDHVRWTDWPCEMLAVPCRTKWRHLTAAADDDIWRHSDVMCLNQREQTAQCQYWTHTHTHTHIHRHTHTHRRRLSNKSERQQALHSDAEWVNWIIITCQQSHQCEHDIRDRFRDNWQLHTDHSQATHSTLYWPTGHWPAQCHWTLTLT